MHPPTASGGTPATTPVADNVADRQTLEWLYSTEGGASWGRNGGWLSDQPMGQWDGVTTEGGYVVSLDLSNNGMNGRIPANTLGQLPRLRSLNLRGNDWSGCIPYHTQLRQAMEQSYNFRRGAGVVPGWGELILRAIHNVLIEHNGVEALRSGEDTLGFQSFIDATYGLGLAPCPQSPPPAGVDPANQSKATDRVVLLTIKDIFVREGTPASSFASWTGELKTDPGAVPFRTGWRGVGLDGNGRVVELSLDERQLRGNIPPELGALGHLEILNLSKNELTGSIPSELGNLSNLQLLALNQNFTPKAQGSEGATDGLSGRLPPELGHLGDLRMLSLDDNPFLRGELPLEWGNLTNIEHAFLQDTGLSGCLPPPIRQNFSPTLGSLLNQLVSTLTVGRLKTLVKNRITADLVEQGLDEEKVKDALLLADESFGLYLKYAPLNQGLDYVGRALQIVSPDTIVKPGSTLSNLGSVRLTC